MNHLSSLLAVTWAASLWQGVALALSAMVFLRLMPRASAPLRHTVLVLVFLLAAVLPFIHRGGDAAGSHHAVVTIAPWFAMGIAVLWLAASTVRAAALLHAWMHLRRVRKNAEPISVEGVATFRAGSRQAVLCASHAVDTPAVLGFFRPVLLLPTWLVPTLSAADLREIALHECEHLRRRDDWTNLLLQIALMLMPLNPALLWLNRSIATERELACDAAVVATTATPLAYAASLTRMAEQRMQRHSLRLALAALGRRSELALRIHTLLREPVTGWGKRQSIFAMTAAAAVLLYLSVVITRAPGLVSIATAAPVSVVAAQPALPAAKPLPTMKMLPVSYNVPPASRPRRKAFHHAPLAYALPHTQPTFLRINAQDRSGMEDAVQYDDRPVRLVTTEFLQPYVAVPMANGWLLIQL